MASNGIPWKDLARSLQTLHGLRLGYYDNRGGLRSLFGEALRFHSHAICAERKTVDMAGCKKWEGSQMDLAYRSGKVVWKTCPWGISEALLSIQSRQGHEGYVFLGPFPTSTSGTPEATREWEPLLLLLREGIERELAALPDSREKGRVAITQEWLHKRAVEKSASLAGLASALGLSLSSTRAFLKKEFQCGFSDLIVRRRVDQAGLRLLHTEETLDRIALLVGYENARSLDKAFRRVTGTSPGRWRERERSKGG